VPGFVFGPRDIEVGAQGFFVWNTSWNPENGSAATVFEDGVG
jgi:hypothetical protein